MDANTGSTLAALRSEATRSARAAIMSRNLSHNVGSHSLANSKFLDAVGVLNEISQAPNDSEEEKVFKIAAPENKRVKRPVQKGEVWRARSRLTTLNNYLQARMDFIARAIDDAPNQLEPIFFINELMRGFLSQTVLLNTLLSDNGYELEDLEFRLKIEDNPPYVFRGKTDDGKTRHSEFDEGHETEGNEKLNPKDLEDVLIAIPGGMVGQHAFYAFLENMMRNAAKYGSDSVQKEPKNKKLVIHLALERRDASSGAIKADRDNTREPCYFLKVWDNVSFETKKETDRIRGYINQSIIDDNGETRREGHGIQEMKVCAQFLAGGDKKGLLFPTDQEANDSDHPAGDDYEKEKQSTSLQSRNALICYRTGSEDNNKHHITYGLLINSPILLGIVDGTTDSEQLPEIKEPTAVYYNDIESLARNPAYFGLVVLPTSEEKRKAFVEDLVNYHRALPYRLMLCLPEREKQSENEENSGLRNLPSEFYDGSEERIPRNRIRVVKMPQKLLDDLNAKDDEKEKRHQAILELYDIWLRAYKGGEKESGEKWKLVIGFDRDRGSVASRWLQSDEKEINFSSTEIDFRVYWKADDGTRFAPCKNDKCGGEPTPELTLALDNHGKALNGTRINRTNRAPYFWPKKKNAQKSLRAYHQFSGSSQQLLFQMLDTPPHEAFSKGFLIRSIAEALLTRVVIVDERLADATVARSESSECFEGELFKQLHESAILPIYQVHQHPNSKKPPIPLSENVRVGLKNRRGDEQQGNLDSEGLALNNDKISLTTLDESLSLIKLDKPYNRPDVFIIHEGVVDRLKDLKAWTDSQTHLDSVFALCPYVVRTSGRGSEPRHLMKELPFLEFSELSSTTYQQLNKVSLGQGLLSLRGELSTQPKV